MFYKVYAGLPREFPVTPLDMKPSLDSVYESMSATRGVEEIFPVPARSRRGNAKG